MQNGQTEPKLYVYTTQALFVHSKKHSKKKEKPKQNRLFYKYTTFLILVFCGLRNFYIPHSRVKSPLTITITLSLAFIPLPSSTGITR